MLSADTINGTNTVLWLNTAANRLHKWTTDSNWNWLSSEGWIDPNSNDGYTLENQFNLDLNKDNTIGAPNSPVENLRSRIVTSNRLANATTEFIDSLIGTSDADTITATRSNQLLTGYDLISGIATQPGQIDFLDGGNLFSPRKTYLLASPSGQPYPNDGDKGFTFIMNFRVGSDDLVLDKNQYYSFAARSINVDAKLFFTGVGIHVDANQNGRHDSSDNLIGLLAYGDPSSFYGGNIARGGTSFNGRIIYI